MISIFALYRDFNQARTAVQALQEFGVREEDLNVLALENTAKNHLDTNLERAGVAVTNEVGEQTLHGLDALLAAQQAVPLHDGDVYAAGDQATVLVRTAAAPGNQQGLQPALEEFGIPPEVAEFYDTEIAGGGLLLWVLADDGNAREVARLLHDHEADHVAHYPEM